MIDVSFCENYARLVADEGGNCPLCKAVISMVMRVLAYDCSRELNRELGPPSLAVDICD